MVSIILPKNDPVLIIIYNSPHGTFPPRIKSFEGMLSSRSTCTDASEK